MTGADARNTEAWIEGKDVRYPVAFDRHSSLAGPYDIGGLPFAILVDPRGLVVWTTRQGPLTEKKLREHLQGALLDPIPSWPRALDAVREAVLSHELGKARRLAAALAKEDRRHQRYLDAVNVLIRNRLDGLEATRRAGDYLAAWEDSELLAEALDGEPEAPRITALRAAIEDDLVACRILEAQRAVRAILQRPVGSRAQAAKHIEELRVIAERHPKTAAWGQAQAAIVYLERVAELLP